MWLIACCETQAVRRTRSGVAGGWFTLLKTVSASTVVVLCYALARLKRPWDFAARFSQRFFVHGRRQAFSHHRSRPAFSPALFVPARRDTTSAGKGRHGLATGLTSHRSEGRFM
jgi:hypothetical protein